MVLPPVTHKGPPKDKPGNGGGGGGGSGPSQLIPSGIQRIGLPEVNLSGVDTTAVTVAVLDTGVDLDHPDLNVIYDITFAGGKNADDKNGHGTHVSGTIGAINNNFGVVGVCPGARIIAVKVLGNGGTGSLSDILAGLDWVYDNTATFNIAVANMSIGGTGRSDAYKQAIQRCVVDKGVFFAVSAGNSARDVYGNSGAYDDGDDYLPAAYPFVSTVTAINDADDTFAYFTNYNATFGSEILVNSSGGAIDLAAPGVSILSTWAGGGYNSISGTSMSSPHVAGAAALYIAIYGRAYDGTGVRLIRNSLISNGLDQASWSGNPGDPDNNHERMLNIRGF
jgi:subtilisin family serine protease